MVGTVVLLTIVGLAMVGWTFRSESRQVRSTGVAGTPMRTDFGSFTVTRVSDTFVPNTQGPPSQHAPRAGLNGSEQLQVWVRLVNDEAENGLRYSSDSFRLVSKNAGQGPQAVTGSSLTRGVLRQGTSIDGRLWFDLDPGETGRRWLAFTAPGAPTVRVALGAVSTAVPPTAAPDATGPAPDATGDGGHGPAEGPTTEQPQDDGHDHDH